MSYNASEHYVAETSIENHLRWPSQANRWQVIWQKMAMILVLPTRCATSYIETSEVAPDGSSFHIWLRHEGKLLPYRQKASREEREVAGSRQGFFALLIHSEGESTALKKLL